MTDEELIQLIREWAIDKGGVVTDDENVLRRKEGVVTVGMQEGTSRAVLFEHSSLPQVLIMPMNVQW